MSHVGISRRRFTLKSTPLLFSAGISACATKSANQSATSDNLDSFAFGKYSPSQVRDASANPVGFTVSLDKRQASLLFDDVRAELVTSDAGLARTVCLSCQIEAHLPDREGIVGYLLSIRGYVGKSANAAVALTVVTSGATKSAEWRHGEESDENFELPVFSILRRPPRETNAMLPMLPPFIMSIMIVVQRDSPSERATLSCDSIDAGSIVS